MRRGSHADVDAHIHPQSNADRDPYTNGHGHADGYSHTDRYSDANRDSNPHANGDCNTDGHTDPNGNADGHSGGVLSLLPADPAALASLIVSIKRPAIVVGLFMFSCKIDIFASHFVHLFIIFVCYTDGCGQ